MKGFLKYTTHAFACAFLFFILGFIFPLFWLVTVGAIFSIPFFPLFRSTFPDTMKKKGYM